MGAFPLLLLVVAAYNAAVFSGFAAHEGAFRETVASFPMYSGGSWDLTLGGVFGIVGLMLLLVEFIRATDVRGVAQVNHVLSLGVFMICMVEFILLKGFGNDTFFALLMMTLIDVVVGYTVAMRVARRDYGIGG